jgi:hypothetical protein
MEKLKLAVRFVVCILPSYLFGVGLTYFFRHIDGRLQFFLTALVILGCMYLITKLRQPYLTDNGDTDEMPFFLHGSMYFFLIFSSFGGLFWSYMAFKADVMFDNGRNAPIVISAGPYEAEVIAAKSNRGMILPVSLNQIMIDGKPKTIDITEKGTWIFNIDKLNTYIEGTVQYGVPNTIKPEKMELPGIVPEPAVTLINDEFFRTKADILFEAPDSLKVKRSEAAKQLSKVVLYRVNVDKNTGNIAVLK